MKTSAQNNYFINELFHEAGELLYSNYIKNNTGNLNQKGIVLEKEKQKEKDKNVCCNFVL